LLSPDASTEALARLFAREPVVELRALLKTLETSSRMSVFRRLSPMRYLSSYSHAGRYYTLETVPEFDRDGLWQRQGVLFSRHGTLKETTCHLVEKSEDGRTHQELRDRLRIRVQNALLELVREERIRRESFEDVFLYLSADAARARAQRARRQEQRDATVEVAPFLVVEVLLEVIRSARSVPDAAVVAARLSARGIPVAPAAVAAVYARHGLGKKTAASASRRSKR
jgi:hypothetical protein